MYCDLCNMICELQEYDIPECLDCEFYKKIALMQQQEQQREEFCEKKGCKFEFGSAQCWFTNCGIESTAIS